MDLETIITLLSDYDYEKNDIYCTLFFIREMYSRLDYALSIRDYGPHFELPEFLEKGE